MEDDLLFSKLDQEGVVSTRKGDHHFPWTKALQRRMERAEEIEAVIAARQGGTKTATFLLRPGEGREFLGKAVFQRAQVTQQVLCSRREQIPSLLDRSCTNGIQWSISQPPAANCVGRKMKRSPILLSTARN